MIVSIIGAGSFLATRIIRALKLDPSVNIMLYAREIHSLPTGNYTVHRYDYPSVPLNFETVKDTDVIIFCAAAGVQSAIVSSVSGEYELNTFEPIRLFQFLERSRFTGKLFTFGSYFELGNNRIEKLFSENDLLKSDFKKPNDYSLSKSLLSRFLFHQGQRMDALPFTFYHLVLSTIYGVGEHPNRIIPYIVRSIKNDEPLALSSGTQVRQYTHIDDVASLVVRMAAADKRPGIYNVTDEATLTIRSLSERVITMAEKKFNKKATVSFNLQGRKDLAMEFLALDASQAKKELGWCSAITLEQGINEYME